MNPRELPYPLQDFTLAALAVSSALGEVDSAAVRVRTLRTAGGVLPNTLEALRIELTYHSNAIEGSTLSLRETQLIIEGKTPGAEKELREVYEARNHDRALRFVETLARDHSEVSIGEKELLELHSIILADIDSAAAGCFRTERVRIVGTGFIPPGSHRFGELIPCLLALPNRVGVHPVIAAAELHYNLVAVHPFADGNGRSARLLMNHHLLRRGYPFALLEIGHRNDYLSALDESNHGRHELFLRLMCESILAGAKVLLD